MGNIALLRADPHRWGLGLTHRIDLESDQTFCGKSPARCPGEKFYGNPEQITCKLCRRSIASRERSAELRAQWERDRIIADRLRQEERARWSMLYADYLQSQTWLAKRAKVMKRANGVCEGCGAQKAVQVHHIRYPRGCLPGSREWIALEKLFDLRAICRGCHLDVHFAGHKS